MVECLTHASMDSGHKTVMMIIMMMMLNKMDTWLFNIKSAVSYYIYYSKLATTRLCNKQLKTAEKYSEVTVKIVGLPEASEVDATESLTSPLLTAAPDDDDVASCSAGTGTSPRLTTAAVGDNDVRSWLVDGGTGCAGTARSAVTAAVKSASEKTSLSKG